MAFHCQSSILITEFYPGSCGSASEPVCRGGDITLPAAYSCSCSIQWTDNEENCLLNAFAYFSGLIRLNYPNRGDRFADC